MIMRALLVALGVSWSVVGVAVKSDRTVSEETILNTLLNNDQLLSRNGQLMLKERTRLVTEEHSKGATSQIDPEVGQFLASLPGGLALLESVQLSSSKSKPPATTVPQIQESKGVIWKDAISRKVRYGPYRIPALSEKNVASEILKIQGVSNTLNFGIKKPCDGSCTILSMMADLEYADGKLATLQNGAWLHHITLLNAGPTVVEPACGYPYVESLFMSGNERSDGGFGITNSNIKSGYSINNLDSFILTTELMNMDDVEKWAWVTVTYDLLDGPHPNFKQGKNVFQTIGPSSCNGINQTNPFGPSNMTVYAQPKSTKFYEYSIPWQIPMDGMILKTGGHMHDGGVSTEIFLNNKLICDSIPSYAKSKPKHGHEGRRRKRQVYVGGSIADNADIEHIQSQTMCDFPDGYPFKKGDTMYLKVNYDFEKHPGMKNKKGELDEIMGIVGTMIAI